MGDEPSEKAHGLRSESSYSVSYRRRSGRDARTGGYVEFDLRSAPGPLSLRLRYWGAEYRRRFRILANDQPVANEVLDGNRGNKFVDVDYPIPATALTGKTLRIRIEPEKGYSAGPVMLPLLYNNFAVVLGLQALDDLAWHGSQDRVVVPLKRVFGALALGCLLWVLVRLLG